ncbi:nucleolar transcription factor 1-A-like [Dendronephthya gigantea]|uniref:nucleolar transcription factor 1-A-like n=1 Tax=Dendronephthya gigantea TaxID=151771 RepID=UPI001069D375|nr:nucleolar transcription factor 1-A-like [Dendronephthya gigantea]
MDDTITQESERRKSNQKKKKKNKTIAADEQESVIFGDADGSQKEAETTTEQSPVARKKHKKTSRTRNPLILKEESTQSDSANRNLRNEKQSTPKQTHEQQSTVLECGDANGSRSEDQATTEQPVRKKHKKSSKTGQESSQSDSADTKRKQKQSTLKPSPDVKEESKRSPEKMAPTPSPIQPLLKQEWTDDQEHKLLENVKMYASKLTGRVRHSQRVNWSNVEKVDNFTETEIQEKYKELTKRVRKTRSVSEIIEDALTLHAEKQNTPPKIRKLGKQRPSAFSIFCKAKRSGLVEKYPDLKFMDVHKRLCQRWKDLSEDKRKIYIEKAEVARIEYDEEMRKFNEKRISALKKPMSAYDLWKTERLQDDSFEGDETESDFLLEWENLPKSNKNGWVRTAAFEQEKYDSKVRSIAGGFRQQGKAGKINEDKKDASETKTKEESTSDDLHQQSSSSLDNSRLKRKSDNSEPAVKAPVNKVSKNDSSSGSDSSDSDSSESDSSESDSS